ncbi:MAG: hypothetical protein ACT4O5_15470 [Gammaproteobacteria bacterium]
MRHFLLPVIAGALLNPCVTLAEAMPAPALEAYAAAKVRYANPVNRFEYADIARQLEEVLRRAPDAQGARLLRIAALVKAGEKAAAGGEMKRVAAVRDKLDDVEQLRLRVLAANLAGKPQEEIRFLNALAERQPEDRWLRYELARAHSEVEQYAQAVEYVDQALALAGPEARWEGSWIHHLHSKALLRSGGDPREAIAAALAGRGEATTWRSTLYRLALAQYAAGDAVAGRNSLEEYVKQARQEGRISDAAVQVNIGLFFYELADYKQAEKHLRDGLALDPDNTYGLWALGFLLIEKPGGLEEGKSVIERGLAKAPNDANLLDARGWALYRANRAAEGYSWLRRAQLAGGDYNQRIVDHLAAVAAELKEPKRPPAPHTRWL